MKKRIFLDAISLLTLLGLVPSSAHAYNLNVFGGTELGSNEYGMAAAELTIPVIAEVGPFFEWSRGASSIPQNRYNAGAVGRITTPWLNFFIDGRAGYGWNSMPDHLAGDSGFSLELGAGYRFVCSTVDILPRIGFNVVSATSPLPVLNLSVGLAFVL